MGSPESRPCERAEFVHLRKLGLISDFLQSKLPPKLFPCRRSIRKQLARLIHDGGVWGLTAVA
jgi:hypothetical protein